LDIDTHFVQKAINGDDEAFLKLMQTYKMDLYKTALAYLGNKEDSLEAIQEVTYRAYRSIYDLQKPAYVKTWLIRIMINYCNDQLKKNKRVLLGDELLNNQSNAVNLTSLLYRGQSSF
jgi:RNA polymerase sigma factor (sigma-70 family)